MREPRANEQLSCESLLSPDGAFHHADLRWSGAQWTRFDVGSDAAGDRSGAYAVPGLPVDLHCHGIGPYDFSVIGTPEFVDVDRIARARGIACVPTLYLLKDRYEEILNVLREVEELRREGSITHILGFGLEGPLLGSRGGTPSRGAWMPTKQIWDTIAIAGQHGLRYMVLSPDVFAYAPNDGPPLEWIVSLLVEAGVKPTLGHFHRASPETSARSIRSLLSLVEGCIGGATRYAVATDHLFNDMPCNIRYAWRTPAERGRREAEIMQFRTAPWTWDSIDQVLGPVPAEILRAARENRLTICMNFDGEHVDLEVCRRVVEFVGADRIIAITDHTEVGFLGGEILRPMEDSGLRVQKDNIVAVGSQAIDRQIQNMRSVGIREEQIWQTFCFQPHLFLGMPLPTDSLCPPAVSYVSERYERMALYSRTS